MISVFTSRISIYFLFLIFTHSLDSNERKKIKINIIPTAMMMAERERVEKGLLNRIFRHPNGNRFHRRRCCCRCHRRNLKINWYSLSHSFCNLHTFSFRARELIAENEHYNKAIWKWLCVGTMASYKKWSIVYFNNRLFSLVRIHPL